MTIFRDNCKLEHVKNRHDYIRMKSRLNEFTNGRHSKCSFRCNSLYGIGRVSDSKSLPQFKILVLINMLLQKLPLSLMVYYNKYRSWIRRFSDRQTVLLEYLLPFPLLFCFHTLALRTIPLR